MKPSPMVYATPALAHAFRDSGKTHASIARTMKKDRTIITKVVNGQREIRRDDAVVLAWLLGRPVDELFTDQPYVCPRCGFINETAGVAA